MKNITDFFFRGLRGPTLFSIALVLVMGYIFYYQPTPLHRAIANNDMAMAENLLVNGVPVDISTWYFQQTPLVYAARMQKPEFCKLFIEYGANMNHVDRSGFSVLDYAEFIYHLDESLTPPSSPDTVNYLIAIGAKRNKEY